MRAAVVARRPHGGARGRDQPRARPTGPGSTGRRCRGPASCSAWCARCVFSPEDLALVKGDPAERRRFLDDLLVLRTPRLAGVRADYDRVLRAAQLAAQDRRRRAPRLARPGAALSTLDVWDAHLARVGAELLAERLALVDDAARRYVGTAYADGRPRRVARRRRDLAYKPSFELDPAARRTARRSTEALLRGSWPSAGAATSSTAASRLVGPHRDDLLLTLGGRRDGRGCRSRATPATASRWSFALALRLASYDLLRADGDDPILILDDVFAELDTERRAQLAELVAGAEQVLVTAAVADDVPAGAGRGPLPRRRRGGDPWPERRRPPTGDPSRPSRHEPDEPEHRDDGLDLARALDPRHGRRSTRRPSGAAAARGPRRRAGPAPGQRRPPRRPRPAAARRHRRPARRRPRLGARPARARRLRAAGPSWSAPRSPQHCTPGVVRRRHAGGAHRLHGLGDPAASCSPRRSCAGSTRSSATAP